MTTPNIFYTPPVKKIAYYRKSMRIARTAMALSETRANYQYWKEHYTEDFNILHDLVFSVLCSFEE